VWGGWGFVCCVHGEREGGGKGLGLFIMNGEIVRASVGNQARARYMKVCMCILAVYV
jgi:hypothetical protein